MRHAESWSDTNYSSVADALSAILELVRQHEVRVEPVAYSGTHHWWAHCVLVVAEIALQLGLQPNVSSVKLHMSRCCIIGVAGMQPDGMLATMQ